MDENGQKWIKMDQIEPNEPKVTEIDQLIKEAKSDQLILENM